MANVFDTEASAFFVGGTGTKAGMNQAGGCTKAWLDAKMLGEHDMRHKPKSGKFVIFISYYPSETTSLKVLRGIEAVRKKGACTSLKSIFATRPS